MVMDFSENYTCGYQYEIQTAFFDQYKVTLFLIMCYYKLDTELGMKDVKHAVIGISDDLKHDSAQVREFEDKAITIL